MRSAVFSIALLAFGSFTALPREQLNTPKYGPVMVIGLTPPEQDSGLTGKMTAEVYSALRQEGKVKVVGEPQFLRSPNPSAIDLVKLANATGAKWIAMVNVSPAKESRNTFSATGVYSVQVASAVAGKIIARSYAVFGYLIGDLNSAVGRARDAITEFASEHREIRVVFDLLTRPGEAEYSIGASSVKQTSKDGLGHWEGTQPVGMSLVRVWKQGYGAEEKSFLIKTQAGSSYLPISLVVELKAGKAATSSALSQ